MNAPTPETKYALSVILEEHGELCEETAPFILVRLCKKLERDIAELNERLIDRQKTLMAELVKNSSGNRNPCDWKQDNDGNWDTSCKQCMCFDYALPFELGYKFCHHCGLPINFINFIKPLDESLDAGGDGTLHDQMGGIRPRERMGNILG